MQASVRLYVLLARSASTALVFRRGPSKRVLLISWNTRTDQFEEGQYFNGRIYERRCDLSPDGKLLVYFAANYKEPYFSWSAVSKPPYLTALALWPKGDAWGGGGQFISNHEVALNLRGNEMSLAEGFRTPQWLRVKPLGEHSGWGGRRPDLVRTIAAGRLDMCEQRQRGEEGRRSFRLAGARAGDDLAQTASGVA